jgi:penicillin-binding protein 1A
MVATSWVRFDDFGGDLGKTSFNKNLGKEQISGGEFGAKTALPAWIEFMQESALNQPVRVQEKPINIATARIDLETGLLTNKTDYTTRFEYFKNGTVPTEYAPANSFTIKQSSKENQQIISTDEDELF